MLFVDSFFFFTFVTFVIELKITLFSKLYTNYAIYQDFLLYYSTNLLTRIPRIISVMAITTSAAAITPNANIAVSEG